MRKILRGVRIEGKVYTAGMEDQLAAALSQDEISVLIANSTLVGDWQSTIHANKANATEKPKRTHFAGDVDLGIALKPLGIDVVGELIEAGYDTLEDVNLANDDELLALHGIGAATVSKIRAIIKEHSDDAMNSLMATHEE